MEVIDWAAPILAAWAFGEDAALRLLDAFLKRGLGDYERHRGRAGAPPDTPAPHTPSFGGGWRSDAAVGAPLPRGHPPT